ncbi:MULTISPECIES: hypothetical protein [unclassified Bartonella]|uniref:hypothetical protein n=1 Tax=unclassified Bartonella TaxID=2645622 RepID=UPI0035CEFD64
MPLLNLFCYFQEYHLHNVLLMLKEYYKKLRAIVIYPENGRNGYFARIGCLFLLLLSV